VYVCGRGVVGSVCGHALVLGSRAAPFDFISVVTTHHQHHFFILFTFVTLQAIFNRTFINFAVCFPSKHGIPIPIHKR
jgi:hypothetical protein